MPEVVITYKKPETLKILKGLAKYFDFKISNREKKIVKSGTVTIIPGDSSIPTADLSDIFSDKNLDAKKLREAAWQRKR